MTPPSERHDMTASLTAVHTERERSKGGSPTAFVPRTFTVFPSFSIKLTLKIRGVSWLLGILYVLGE
jgi:hypothetical protein